MRLGMRRRLSLALLGFVSVAAVAIASEGGIPDDQEVVVGLDHSGSPSGGSSGPHTVLSVHRSALSGGAFYVTVTIEIHAVGVLNVIRLETGDDTNANGWLSSTEWTLVGSSNGTVAGGVTTATIGPVQVLPGHGGYRVVVDRSDLGVGVESIYGPGVLGTE